MFEDTGGSRSVKCELRTMTLGTNILCSAHGRSEGIDMQECLGDYGGAMQLSSLV